MPSAANLVRRRWCCCMRWGSEVPTGLRSAGRFAERFRVFAFDLRGHGDSDWPGEYSFRLMRDDVAAALDELGLAGVALVGR